MVIERTLFLSKLSLTPNVRLRDSHISSPSLNFQPLSLRLSSFSSRKYRRLVSGGPISCSRDYSNSSDSNAIVYEQQYPRPAEIQWKKELCNSVQLIGIVAKPVQIKHLSSGKVIAWSRLAVKKSQNETGWIDLKFWNELAHVAFQHVEEGRQVYVSGRLVLDALEGDDGKQQTYYKVVVQQINFVGRNSSSPAALHDGEFHSMTPGRKPKNYVANSTGSIEELYQERLNAMEAEHSLMAAKHEELEAKVAMFEQMFHQINVNKMPQ